MSLSHAHTHGCRATGPQHPPGTPEHRQGAFEYLLAEWVRASSAPTINRWYWLEAAHTLGQTTLSLHWRAHAAMLRYAWALRDVQEVFGQLKRLALVPLGHLLRRLPIGNSGRAQVSAFSPMVPSAEVAVLMDQALRATLAPGAE